MFDQGKFKALVHYVVARAGGKPNFGAVKLNKVLWFADARQYQLTGVSITGEEYVRQQFGPVPRHITPVCNELVAEGAIQVTKQREAFEGTRFRSLKPADARSFSKDELQNVDWWIAHIADEHTATSISDESHDYAWDIAKMGEVLPMHAFLATRIREPRGDELEWARAVAKRLG